MSDIKDIANEFADFDIGGLDAVVPAAERRRLSTTEKKKKDTLQFGTLHGILDGEGSFRLFGVGEEVEFLVSEEEWLCGKIEALLPNEQYQIVAKDNSSHEKSQDQMRPLKYHTTSAPSIAKPVTQQDGRKKTSGLGAMSNAFDAFLNGGDVKFAVEEHPEKTTSAPVVVQHDANKPKPNITLTAEEKRKLIEEKTKLWSGLDDVKEKSSAVPSTRRRTNTQGSKKLAKSAEREEKKDFLHSLRRRSSMSARVVADEISSSESSPKSPVPPIKNFDVVSNKLK